MKQRRVLRVLLLTTATILIVVSALAGSLWGYLHPRSEWIRGLVYGQRHGQDLTLDVVRPARANGLGIVLMVSGGWRSGTNSFHPWMAAPLLRRGYTIFAVCHVSQPKATLMEIAEDANRAVRHIRYHAGDYGVDPERLGVTGGSAGGHLSLLLATRGGPGRADAPDPIDRETSTVQAVAIFYPVTDLLNLGKSTENAGDGGPPRNFVKVIGRDLSPVYHVTSSLPPVLIYHGDADTLVPLDQSERFQARARAAGARVELVVHRGGKHGWLTMVWDVRRFGKWFDQHLRPKAGSS